MAFLPVISGSTFRVIACAGAGRRSQDQRNGVHVELQSIGFV